MAEFTWLNKQGVKSELGFTVQFTGRFTAEYREGLNSLILDVEDGFSGGRSCISYSRSSFNKFSDPVERSNAILNFRRAIEFQGLVPIEY